MRCAIVCGAILAAAMFAAQGAQIATEATEPTVSRKTYETEVCVVGGGMAGICASVAAARNGESASGIAARRAKCVDRPYFERNF